MKQNSGIILIDKTIGPTSRQVVNGVTKQLMSKKVGHVGTLDPFASGLLILTVNQATKIGAYLEALDKTYIAKIKLGEKTDTGDLTGKVIESKETLESLDLAKINDVLALFLGKRTQIPPMYSALKRDGKPLYKYAREGIELERLPRDIEIFEIQLLSFGNNVIEFSTRVSKGTYLRTLAEEIAVELGSVGHLIFLRRTAIGDFKISD
ncbi:MAG: tRNA pseudouridine(55) synthase TruB, partial [Bacilli bacterium]|nr:tRNA pseudouridine(55) synthase TruB [Bacilli bacterium]